MTTEECGSPVPPANQPPGPNANPGLSSDVCIPRGGKTGGRARARRHKKSLKSAWQNAREVKKDHGTDAPMAHPRPGYRSRSTPGPTAVDRRRWFGLDRCNGHGLKARPGHRGTSCLHRVQQRSTIWLFLFTDMVVAVHGGHESTSIGSPTPLLRSRVVQRTHIYAEKTHGRGGDDDPTRSAADYFAARTTAPA
ncbi:hypothetical protein THAOC_14767, partial [Thalassiosira oceanica]